MKSANVKSSSTSFGVVPPANFSYLEENICRCTYPITRHNLNFVQSTNLNYIVNLSGRKHDQAVLTFFEEKNIEVVKFCSNPSLLKSVLTTFYVMHSPETIAARRRVASIYPFSGAGRMDCQLDWNSSFKVLWELDFTRWRVSFKIKTALFNDLIFKKLYPPIYV